MKLISTAQRIAFGPYDDLFECLIDMGNYLKQESKKDKPELEDFEVDDISIYQDSEMHNWWGVFYKDGAEIKREYSEKDYKE